MTYDGSINILTKIDASGMNKGTKSIASSLAGVLRAVKGVGAALGLAFSGAAIFSFVKRAIESFDIMGSAMGDTVRELKGAFDLFKGALVNAVLAGLAALTPYIMVVVNWLTRMLTILAQVITALFGVKRAMLGVASATDKTTKKTQGSLAAFDQINVLQKKEDDGSGGGTPLLPDITIPADLLAKIEAFKAKMLEFLSPVIEAFGRLKKALEPLGQDIWEGLQWAWEFLLVPLGNWVMNEAAPAFLDLLAGAATALDEALIALKPSWDKFYEKVLTPIAEWAGDKFIEFLEWLTEKLYELADWIKENPEKFRTIVEILGTLWAIFALIGVALLIIMTPLGQFIAIVVAIIAILGTWATLWYKFIGQYLVKIFKNAWEEIKKAWEAASEFFGIVFHNIWAVIKFYWDKVLEFLKPVGEWLSKNIAEPFKKAFGPALDWIKDKFETVFGGLKTFLKGVVNGIIDIMNGLMKGIIIGGLNGMINGLNSFGLSIPDWIQIPLLTAPKIPRLATGAVIPPNAEFAAILGDNKSQKELIGPEDMFRRIIQEESGKNVGRQEITIRFEGTMGALVRELKPYIDKEAVRVGGSLIKSGVVV